ncbi:MAG: hypothetical protein ABW047_14880 [Nitrospiraceae bacterium]
MIVPLTFDAIQSVIEGMPIQGRIMLKLMLLQHFDIDQEEAEYIAADRPDPRCVAGTKPFHKVTRDAIDTVLQRRDQYLRQVRLRRERVWLQMECMRKLIHLDDAICTTARHLLMTRFGMTPAVVDELTQQARAAVPKPAIRALDRRWDANEIPADDYQKERLGIELQTQIRLADKHHKRLELAEREWTTAHAGPLQDHEIAHIWGIPAGSLLARKVKYLHQYIQAQHARMRSANPPAEEAKSPPLDIWAETLAVLAKQPVERSVAAYDGLEKTEEALVEKLHQFVASSLPEESEGKFWLSLVHGASSNAVHSETTRTVFGLQRLVAILGDFDSSDEALEQHLLAKTAPISKEDPALLDTSVDPSKEELSELQEHILRSFVGEQHRHLT